MQMRFKETARACGLNSPNLPDPVRPLILNLLEWKYDFHPLLADADLEGGSSRDGARNSWGRDGSSNEKLFESVGVFSAESGRNCCSVADL
jgi:hypothetical protein